MAPRNKGYNGNINLKPSNQAIEWTPELVAEYVKCSQDPIYFTETYMKIVNIDNGLVSFKLYPYQREMIQSFAENRFSIIATARQAGKSTVTCAFILWYTIFHPEKTVALLANKGETAREILQRIQLSYQYLPRWLQQGIKEFRAGAMVFEVSSAVFHTAKLEKRKHKTWRKYLEEDDCLAEIREYANKNPGRPIILKNKNTGEMTYARYGKRKV